MADNSQNHDLFVERRAARRFPIEQDASYKILDHRAASSESGAAKTVDISSDGVLFETEQRLRSGKRIELSINWPAALDGGCPLKFVAYGRIVRAGENQAAMRIEQHEFRTRRSRELPAAPEKQGRDGLPYY